jgi:hypothetical protein
VCVRAGVCACERVSVRACVKRQTLASLSFSFSLVFNVPTVDKHSQTDGLKEESAAQARSLLTISRNLQNKFFCCQFSNGLAYCRLTASSLAYNTSNGCRLSITDEPVEEQVGPWTNFWLQSMTISQMARQQ